MFDFVVIRYKDIILLHKHITRDLIVVGYCLQ